MANLFREEQVLAILEQDIEKHPERLRPLPADLVQQIMSLVGSMDVDLDAPLFEDDEPEDE